MALAGSKAGMLPSALAALTAPMSVSAAPSSAASPALGAAHAWPAMKVAAASANSCFQDCMSRLRRCGDGSERGAQAQAEPSPVVLPPCAGTRQAAGGRRLASRMPAGVGELHHVLLVHVGLH